MFLFKSSSLFAGSVVMMLASAAKIVMQVATTAVLARLLRPEDFGLVAMASVVTGFLFMFSEAGLSVATVQRYKISQSQVSTLFYLNVLLGLAVALLLLLTAPIIAHYCGDPRLVPVISVLGFVGVGTAMAAQYMALFQREMRWGALRTATLGGQFIGSLAAVAAAWFIGLGYWSLVVMQIVTTVCTLALLMRLGRWLPTSFRLSSDVRQMLSFGGYVTGSKFLNYWTRKLDDLLVGSVWGAGDLGLYSRAYQIMTLPITLVSAPLATVVVPALAKLQNDGAAWARQYLSFLSAMLCLTSFMAAALLVFAQDVVLLLLGRDWVGAIPVFKVLALTIFVQPITNSMGWLYQSLGRGREMLWWGILASPVYIVAFVVGVQFSMMGVAIAYSVAVFIIAIPCILYGTRATPLTLSAILWVSLRPVVAAVAAAALALLYLGAGEHALSFIGGGWLGAVILMVSYPFVLQILYLVGPQKEFDPLRRLVRLLRTGGLAAVVPGGSY